MEIGNEISQKIRSAIKTKLVELGAYEDEELPDYIMVMVANKKTREQMNEDLHLFLGGSTEKFTAWLLSILNKLKAITIGNPPNVAAVIPQEINISKNLQSNSNSADNKEPEMIPELLLQPETDEFNEEQEEINTLNESEKSDISKDLTSTCDKINKVKSDFKTASSISAPVTKMTSRVQPSMHYLNSAASNNIISQTESSISNESTISSQSTTYIFPKNKPITSRLQMDLISNSHRNQIPKVITHPIISREDHQLQLTRQNKKRRVPGSVIGSIIHHSSEEEEEYDPYNPSYGSVASVIRVTERKSSIPPELQANKCLLLKAVKDAHKSLATQEKRTAEHAMIKPMFHEVPEKKLKMSERIKNKRPLFTQTKLAEHDNFSLPNQFDLGDDDDELEARQNKLRQVECNKPGQRIAVIKHLDSVKMNEELHNEPKTDIEFDEDIQLCSDLLNFSDENVVDTPPPARIVKKNKKETEDKTQFIVTLDGYDGAKGNETPSFLSQTDQSETNTSMQYQMAQIKPLAFNITDTTDEDEEVDENKNSTLKTSTEKCKFWPSCQNGTHCKYYHPTSPCSKFPKCKFGQSCLYIHPKCKFDSKCTRTDCPFSHSFAKTVAPSRTVPSVPTIPVAPPATRQPPTQTPQCKFFPTCKNMNCPFSHPKPCRYGISCTNKTFCTFYHPPLPNKNQLRWQSEKSRAEDQSDVEDEMELNVVHWNNPYKVVNTSS